MFITSWPVDTNVSPESALNALQMGVYVVLQPKKRMRYSWDLNVWFLTTHTQLNILEK